LEKAANFRASDWFLAGMQLHWFLNQNCNLELDWTNHKLRTDLYFDISLAPFSFKWNGAFCPKRRRFIHCWLRKKKEKPETVPFWWHCGSSSSPRRVRQGKKKIFLRFPLVGRAVEEQQHSGRHSHVSPLFFYKYRGDREQKRGQRGKRWEKRGETKKKERRRRENNEKQRRERRKNRAVATTANCQRHHQRRCLSPLAAPPTTAVTVGQPFSLSFFSCFVPLSLQRLHCSHGLGWAQPTHLGRVRPS